MAGAPGGIVSQLFNGSQLLYLVAAIIIGGRLLFLAKRTRQLPELLLGINFVVGSVLGYMLLVVGMIGIVQPGADLAFSGKFVTIGWLFLSAGISSSMLFTYVVYRRGVAWARALGLSLVTMLWLGFFGRLLAGDFMTPQQFQGTWYFVHQLPIVVSGLWALIEPMVYYASMRKRLRIGLTDPVVTNRFLLWSGASLCAWVMVLLGNTPALYERIDVTLIPVISTVTLTMIATAGLIAVSLYWLTFFPPQFYLRRLAGAAAD